MNSMRTFFSFFIIYGLSLTLVSFQSYPKSAIKLRGFSAAFEKAMNEGENKFRSMYAKERDNINGMPQAAVEMPGSIRDYVDAATNTASYFFTVENEEELAETKHGIIKAMTKGTPKGYEMIVPAHREGEHLVKHSTLKRGDIMHSEEFPYASLSEWDSKTLVLTIHAPFNYE